jgi:sugar phosphate permease
LRALFGRPSFWVLETLNAFTSVANWTIYAWLPTYLHERYHLGLGPAGLSATATLQLPSFAAILLGGFWADRWSRRNPRGRMFVPALGFCLAAPGLWAVGLGGSLELTLGGIALYGLGRGCYDANLMPLLRQLVDERYSATGYGCLNCVASVVGGLMTLLGGILRDHHVGLGIVFRACAAGILATSALLVALRPQRRAPAAGRPGGPREGMALGADRA